MDYLLRQIDEIKSYRWGFFARKIEKFRYIDPVAGLLFTLTRKHYETEGCRFVIPKDLTCIIYRARFYHDLYEWEERQQVSNFVRADDRVLEIGACIGILSCLTNTRLSDNPGMHVVVEPNPELLPYIKENRALNGCSFSIEQCLITDEEDPVFYTADHISKGSAIQRSSNQVNVKSCRLADLENKYGQFNVLIMDIQGAESELLELEQNTLAHFRLVIAEFHPTIIGKAAVERCRAILRDLGFQLKQEIGDVEAWQKEEGS